MNITEPIDQVFASEDCNKNNILHLTGAVFSERFFPMFTQDKDFNTLKPVFRKLLKGKNDKEQTPIEIMLMNDPPIKRLERLIEFDLLEKGSFHGF